MALDLDTWLPDPQVRTRHERFSPADPQRLWRAAAAVRIREAPVLGTALRWRIPGTPADLTFRDLLRSYPFTVLEEAEHCSVSGMCGRIWTRARDYPRIGDADQFRAWDQPGTVRVLIATWIEPGQDGRNALVSESRVQAVDARAGIRLRMLWAVVGRLERLVGGEVLRAAVSRAERN